jgi:hypothetical protein
MRRAIFDGLIAVATLTVVGIVCEPLFGQTKGEAGKQSVLPPDVKARIMKTGIRYLIVTCIDSMDSSVAEGLSEEKRIELDCATRLLSPEGKPVLYLGKNSLGFDRILLELPPNKPAAQSPEQKTGQTTQQRKTTK